MKSSRRYALFFVLLVIGQELCLARHAYLETHPLNKQLDKREVQQQETGVEARSNRQKRGVGTIVLAVALATSVASISTEIYFAIEKCCGAYPQACRDRDEFKRIEKEMDVTTKEIDAKALDTENLKEYVIQANYKLQEMWTQMQLIGEYTEELVRTLGPEIVQEMNNKWAEIEDQLKAKNETVIEMSYTDVEDQYATYFSSFKTTMIGLSSFIGLTLTAVGTAAFNNYKSREINKLVDDLGSGKGYKQLQNAKNGKAAKVMGYSSNNIDGFIKNTATQKVNGKFGGGTFTAVMNGINIVGGLLSIGFDIYAIINRFKYCRERKDQVAKALAQLKITEVELDDVQKNVTDYYDFLETEGWTFITSQVANAQFQETLREFKELAEGSDAITPSLETASNTIDNFLANINGSIDNPKETYDLIDELGEALKGITVRMRCYVDRGRLLKHVSDECKRGANSLQVLYNNSVDLFGVEGDFCILDDKGNTYTTFSGIEKSIKQTLAPQENYNPDCILNSPDKKKEACGYEQDGYTESQIASKMSLTVQQVQFFLSDCPEPELTPNDKKFICRLSMMGDSAAEIKSFLGLSQSESTIQKVIDTEC